MPGGVLRNELIQAGQIWLQASGEAVFSFCNRYLIKGKTNKCDQDHKWKTHYWNSLIIHKYTANTSFVLISVAAVSRSFWKETTETAAMSETANDLEM